MGEIRRLFPAGLPEEPDRFQALRDIAYNHDGARGADVAFDMLDQALAWFPPVDPRADHAGDAVNYFLNVLRRALED